MRFIGRLDGMSTYKVKRWYIHGQNKKTVLKMLEKRKRNELFYISISYSEITPESAQLSDFSETGFDNYGYFGTLRDALKAIEDNGWEDIQNNGTALTVYGNFYTSDYSTGTDRQECIHVTGPKRAVERLFKLLQGDK